MATISGTSKVFLPICFVALIGLLTACSSSNRSSDRPSEQIMGAVLSGDQEVPSVQTDASGTGTVTLNAARTEIEYGIDLGGTFNGLITQAHFHVGAVGENGPVILWICTNLGNAPANIPAPPPCPQTPEPLSGTFTTADFVPGGGLATFADAIAALLGGDTYINVHSDAHPPGEVRGQVGGLRFGVTLSGAAEVVPVVTDAIGSGSVDLNRAQTQLDYTLEVTGPFTSAITQAHIHVGAEGENGPVIHFLCTDLGNAPAGVEVPLCSETLDADGSLAGLLTTDELVPQPGAGVEDFADGVNALISGRTYINVHTIDNPGGEIRGQNVFVEGIPPPVAGDPDF